MADNWIRLGPWQRGVDAVHGVDHPTFEPPGPEGRPVPALHAAVNLDINDAGEVSRRDGLAAWVTAATAGKAVFSELGLLLMQDGGKIIKVTGEETSSDVVTGLDTSARVHFHAHDGQVWWTNGIVCGRILSDGTAKNWGMTVPPTPTVGTTAGDLPAGIYQVAATYLDANGIESGAGKAAVVTLDGTKDITATLTPNDSNAAYVVWYVTGPDVQGRGGLFRQGATAVGSLPATIATAKVTKYHLKTQHMRGPVPGSGIWSFKDVIGTWSGQWLYPQSGISKHLFLPQHESIYVPHTVLAVQGVSGGVWVATAYGLYFISGDSPATAEIRLALPLECCAGSSKVPGTWFPQLQTGSDVAVFLSTEGPVLGLPDGTPILPAAERQALTVTSKLARFAVRRSGELRQLIFTLG